MGLLLLKLLLTPILIGGASLAARRWGPVVGGWLVALPLTSGPVALYLALGQGPSFAASAADGSLGGLLGDATFALAYALAASKVARTRAGWPAALAAGVAGFTVAAIGIQPLLGGPVIVLLAAVVALMCFVYWLAPAAPAPARGAPLPWWDLPARIVVGTALVLSITEAADFLGPHVSGVVATFPVYVSVLAVFAHHLEGPEHAVGIVRGLQLGLFGTTFFMATLSASLVPLGVGPAFVAALAVLLAVHGAILVARRRMGSSPATVETVGV